MKMHTPQALELVYKTYLLEAQNGVFDSYLIYLEKDREPEKRFYLPRRKQLLPLVNDLQDLFDGKIDFLGVSLPPRVGKSTLCILFMTFVIGHRPDVANVMSGHSGVLTEGFYREILSIISDGETYRWADVFPGVDVVNTSAKNCTLDLKKAKRFPTMTCRSVGGTLTGAVEIGGGGILYCDDLIEDLEESLNPQRLQNKYDAYLNQLKDRKKLGALELMVGTRWNVFDPLGRIAEQYADNPRYRFRVIPALDENDESNFNYLYGLGFDKAYYVDMRNSIDAATWWAKYMGQPYIREGLLFPADELQTYNGVLPEGDPDRIVAVCDVAFGGGDSLSMPIAYVYGDAVYIHDVVFNDGDKEVTRPVVVGKLKMHHPHMARFEANNGGDAYCEKVDEILRGDGVRINMTTQRAPTTQSKLSRIIQFAPDIKKFYFIDEAHRSKEYRAFMKELTLFVQTGKNKHDDAPDSLAMLCELLDTRNRVVTVMRRPF
jgi:predicted phage terminase large subunit-like protein